MQLLEGQLTPDRNLNTYIIFVEGDGFIKLEIEGIGICLNSSIIEETLATGTQDP